MANDRRGCSYFTNCFSFGLYKRNQGRIARQVTFAALAVIVALGRAGALSEYLGGICARSHGLDDRTQRCSSTLCRWRCLVVGSVGQLSHGADAAFADFLISVEAEMNKVSWPSRGELFRASMVVILVIFFLAVLLFAYDCVADDWCCKLLDSVVDWMFGSVEQAVRACVER